ncbi:MAG: hypothetical protein ACJ74Z_13120 [Bryobacteraceae bacterium]
MRFRTGLCVLAALIAAVSCSRLVSKGVVVDSSFVPFIPAGTKALAGVQITKLQTAPLYRAHKEQLDFGQLQAFSERTGLDPTRDLSEILITWDGKQFLAMARGHFSQANVGPKLESLGARRTPYKNYILFGDGRNSLVFMRDGLIVAGSSLAVRELIDGRDKSNAGIPPELQQRLETIPKADQLWGVSTGALPVNGIAMRSDIDSALSNIVGYVNGAAIGIVLDTGIHLQADLTCISDPGAQRVRDALRGGIGLARLTTKDNQLELLRLYDSVRVDQENSTIRIRADIAPDLANTVFSYLPQMKNGAGRMLERVP